MEGTVPLPWTAPALCDNAVSASWKQFLYYWLPPAGEEATFAKSSQERRENIVRISTVNSSEFNFVFSYPVVKGDPVLLEYPVNPENREFFCFSSGFQTSIAGSCFLD